MSDERPEEPRQVPPQSWGPPPQQSWGPPPQQSWGPPPQQWWGPAYPGGAAGPQPWLHQGHAPWPPVPPAQRLPSFPHPEPREYHQMLRTWNYAWWKPVVGILLVAVGMLLVAPLVLLPILALGVSFEGGPFWESFENAATMREVGPASLLYLNLTLGSTILLTWFVMRVVHRMRPRWLTSVVPKMRWKFFFICVGLSVVALVAQILVSLLMPGSQEADPGAVNDFTRTTAILAVIVLLTTPFQAAGEEYVFRGYLMQALGSLFGNKWLALVATSTLFAFAHGVQNFPLWFDRFAFGFIAGWLIIRTGGLEAGIAMHILNNFLAFGIALSFGDLTESLTISEVGWSNILLTLTQAGVYAALVLVVANRLGLQRTTRPPHRPPAQPAASGTAFAPTSG